MSALSLLAVLALAQMPAASPAAAPQQPEAVAQSAQAQAAQPAPQLQSSAAQPAQDLQGSAAQPASAPAATPAAAPAAVRPPPPLPPVPPGADGTPVKVERRRLLKQGRGFLTLGPTYLARGDYYRSPGITGSASYYPREYGGLELKLALFFSSLTGAGREVFERTGLVPEAHRPSFVGAVGWRQSVGYGKALLGSNLTSLVHFDLQLAGHLGLTFTDRATNPTLALGPGLLVRTRTLFLQVDAPLVGSLESRSRTSVALGMLPSVTLGIQL